MNWVRQIGLHMSLHFKMRNIFMSIINNSRLMSLIFLIYPADDGRILYAVYLLLPHGHSNVMTFLHLKVHILADATFPLVQFPCHHTTVS